MSTKRAVLVTKDCLSAKNNNLRQTLNAGFGTSVRDDQYNSINLNQSHKCENLKIVHIGSNLSNNKRSDYGVVDHKNYTEKNVASDSWKKKDLLKSFEDLCISEENSSILKNEKNKIKNSSKNASTLSLHIAAYENSIEAAQDIKDDATMKPFKFPRQQQETVEFMGVEMMQFKTSTKLCIPNMPVNMSILGQFAKLSLTTTSRFPSIIQAAASFHSTAILPRSIRDVHKSGVKFMEGEINTFEGTHGAQSYVAVNTQNVNRFLPLPETMKQEFNGIPYNELPILYIKATKNNTLIHATDYKAKAIMYTSCRLEGFKNARKKTNIAGQTTGIAAGQRLLRRGINTIRVCVKGIGPGRMTSVQGLASAGVNVVSITDRTPLCELGPRPRKIRRV